MQNPRNNNTGKWNKYCSVRSMFFLYVFTAIPAVKKDHALIILPMFLAVLGVIMLKQARKNSQKRKKLEQCAADLF